MKYHDPRAFRQALEQRLKTHSGGNSARLARDRKRVVFDRLLARLLAVAANQWRLKGGFALDLRLTDRARATKDIDIDWQADQHILLDTLLDATHYDAGDFFVFQIKRTNDPDDRLGGSHRFRVTASLAGRPFETFLIDVGFDHNTTIPADLVSTTDTLTFADIPPIDVPTLPLEYQIAEKLHAYTRAYADDQPSSRVKDLVDIALIAHLQPLHGHQLRHALHLTFTRRATHALPTTLPTPPHDWATPYRQLATAVGIAPELDTGHHTAAALLNPILHGTTVDTWDPHTHQWSPSTPH